MWQRMTRKPEIGHGMDYQDFDKTISWKKKKQAYVALSTTEEEYMAASDAVKENIWMKDLLFEL